MVSLECKDSIDSRQQRLIFSLLNMVNVIVSHVEHDVLFYATEGFDDELVIIRKEEE